MMINLGSRRARRVALVVFALATLPTLWLGLRTYRSFQLLQSAYAAGAAKTSSIRPWMTLDYVAATHHVPATVLIERLGLPADRDRKASLKALADQAQVAPIEYVQRLQRVIAERPSEGGPPQNLTGSGWFGAIGDRILTALLMYGYPMLALTLLLGAAGLPLPSGMAATVAGSLAAQGRMSWVWAGMIAVAAAVSGDMVGYGLGRVVGRDVMERHGRWFGYSPGRRARIQSLFDRWGPVTIFVTRTFVSSLSSIANLFAGMSQYGLPRFLLVAVAGRVVWTAAYLGLGYGIGGDLEAATGFLTNLSAVLVSLTVLAASGLVASRRGASSTPAGAA